MTKLIEIPFDANLLGQDGIVVKTNKDEDLDFINIYDGYIISVTKYGTPIFGKDRLKMYRESKVMSVEDFKADKRPVFVNPNHVQYWNAGVDDLAAAIKNGEVEI